MVKLAPQITGSVRSEIDNDKVKLTGWGEVVLDCRDDKVVCLQPRGKLSCLLIVNFKQKLDLKMEIDLNQPGSEALVFGLVWGRKGKCNLCITQHHLSLASSSRVSLWSFLTGQADFTFQGLVKIERDAVRSNAYQYNRNLLLSQDAKARSDPRLEIHGQAVKCSHGVATGPLDARLLLYLQSRGLSFRQATKLLIKSHVDQALAILTDATLQQHAATLIADLGIKND